MPSLELNVTGMMCGGCTGSVEAVVSKVDGVIAVKAEHQPANKVTIDGVFDEAAVKAVITKAGFTVES